MTPRSQRLARGACLVVACGAISCGPALRPCISGCNDPLPAAFEAAPGSAPATIDLIPTEPWRDSGVAVRRGDRLFITATGEVTWEGDHVTTTPDGDHGRPLWRVGRGGLVARVGTEGRPFDVGARTGLIPDRHPRPPHHPSPPPPLLMAHDGELFLGFKRFTPGANRGRFEVTIVPARRRS